MAAKWGHGLLQAHSAVRACSVSVWDGWRSVVGPYRCRARVDGGSSRGHHCGGAGLVAWPHEASAVIDLPASRGCWTLRSLGEPANFAAGSAAPPAGVRGAVVPGLVVAVRPLRASLRAGFPTGSLLIVDRARGRVGHAASRPGRPGAWAAREPPRSQGRGAAWSMVDREGCGAAGVAARSRPAADQLREASRMLPRCRVRKHVRHMCCPTT